MEYLSNVREITRDIIFPPSPDYTEEDYPSLDGKVYIVTGASSGIGFESAKLLVSKGARVYITGRTPEKIEAALRTLNETPGNGSAEVLPIHHEDLSTVRPAVNEFLEKEDRLDGIIHNAGINYRGQNIIEPLDLLDIIVINVVCSHLIQRLLIPIMEETEGSRIVWVSSAIHYHSPPYGGIDWHSMNDYDAGGYLGKGNGMYGQTKAMNIYEGIQWGKHHPKVASVICHPGTVYSDIRRSNKWRKAVMETLSKPTVWGSYAEVQLLLSPDISTSDNGQYFVPFGQRARVRTDVGEAANGPRGDKFWQWLQDKTQPYFMGI